RAAAATTASAVSTGSTWHWLKRFTSAGPEANSSSTGRTQLWHRGQTTLIGLLARTSAFPRAPAYGRPWRTSVELIPVPIVTKAMLRYARPAPNRASAIAAARTSASTQTGPTGANTSVSDKPRQSMVWLLVIWPIGSTSSGTPKPTPTNRSPDGTSAANS